MSIEEIHDLVDSTLHLTFDYMSLMVIASIIVVTGLAVNSSVVVVAGMLISPLMGPLLGMVTTFASVKLTRRPSGLSHEIGSWYEKAPSTNLLESCWPLRLEPFLDF